MNFIPSLSPNLPSVLVEACKYDGSVYRSWNCQLIEETEDLWTFVGIFDKEIQHPLLGVIRPDTISIEYYWKNRCYNVFRFHEPEGELRNFYCNVNLPPTMENGVLKYIDLDIDVLVWEKFNYEVLDLEEFEENAEKFSYSPELREKAVQSLNELITMIETRQFPFDITLQFVDKQ